MRKGRPSDDSRHESPPRSSAAVYLGGKSAVASPYSQLLSET